MLVKDLIVDLESGDRSLEHLKSQDVFVSNMFQGPGPALTFSMIQNAVKQMAAVQIRNQLIYGMDVVSVDWKQPKNSMFVMKPDGIWKID